MTRARGLAEPGSIVLNMELPSNRMVTPMPAHPDKRVSPNHGLLVDIGFDSPQNDYSIDIVANKARDNIIKIL